MGMVFGRHMNQLYEDEKDQEDNFGNTNENEEDKNKKITENDETDNKYGLYLLKEKYKEYCEGEFYELNCKKSFEEFKRDYNKKDKN